MVKIGHIMCAPHDSKNAGKYFNDSYYIMHEHHSVLSPYVPTSYSSESRKSIYKSIVVAVDKFVSSEEPSVCGNGVKESDEQCDPGFLGENKCCTKNCRLVPGAQCSWNQDCCRHNCTFAQEGDPCQRQFNETTTGFCKGLSDVCEIVEITHRDETVTHHTVSYCFYFFEFIFGGCTLSFKQIFFLVTTAVGFCAVLMAISYFILSKNSETKSVDDGFPLKHFTSCMPTQNAYKEIDKETTDDTCLIVTHSTKFLPE
uniref:Disintegrin domain-containing protein n=1 Tax=Panagrellus redivivus TaxID=6233 RepID=A0A7E4W2F0_PANRE